MLYHLLASLLLTLFVEVQGRVVSGHKEVLGEVQALATAKGAMKVAPLSVSGAFHSPLMQPAQDKLKQVNVKQSLLVSCLRQTLSHSGATLYCCNGFLGVYWVSGRS